MKMSKPSSLSPIRNKIVCRNLPDDLYDQTTAHKYFQQFGPCRIRLNSKRNSCFVDYDSFEDAQEAILNGGEYKGRIFGVNWSAQTPKRKLTKKDRDPTWEPDDEVQQELEAMGAAPMTHTLRSQDDIQRREEKFKNSGQNSFKRTWKSPSTPNKKSAVKSQKWTPQQLELLTILKRPAANVEEKFKVLEARDKLIRLRTKKETNLIKTQFIVGTCLDMCPERERLMREVQHRVAPYEQDANGRLNPLLAVKEYSRSSADQEVPLPHELRPVSTLQLTMGYLVHRLMNLCDMPDVNLADWYHFLWDRTRSIRKDITQQELCSQGSVSLMEQCARFHIHCSARLVAEDPSVFDQKINTENLTKCLQTLKYMYHDLELKGESCPNEAEFRAYIILLNLNDGNFMWEVQQLKPEIQKSAEIKFALSVYSALNTNNFVKFFKLVHSTGYLNACILLRYFVQVRYNALAIIVKCYAPRLPQSPFSIIDLTKILAFEDVDSTIDFVVSYGLYVNELETHVVLDRKAFRMPELPYSLDRAYNVVESKRTQSVGEVVYGGPLPFPTFKNYIPSNNFEENGVFIVESIVDQIQYDMKEDIVDELDSVEPVPVQEQPIITSTISVLNKPDVSTNIFGSKLALSQFPPSSKNDFSSNIFAPKLIVSDNNSNSPKTVSSIFNKSGSSNSNIFKSGAISSVPVVTQSVFSDLPSTSDGAAIQPFFNAPSVNSQFINIFGPKEKSGSVLSTVINQPTLMKMSEPSKTTNVFAEFVPKQNAPTFIRKPPEFIFSSPNEVKMREKDVDVKLQESLKLLEERKRVEMMEKEYQLLEEKNRLRELEIRKREEIENEKRKMEEKIRLEAERSRKRAEEERARIEIERKKKLEEENKRKTLEKERQLMLEIKKSVSEVMHNLLTEVEENVKRDRLQEIASNIVLHKMKLFVDKWKHRSSAKKKLRQCLDQNPVWLSNRSVEEEAEELRTNCQLLNLQDLKRYRSGRSLELSLPTVPRARCLKMVRFYDALTNVHARIYGMPHAEMFWKIGVSMPTDEEFGFGLRHLEKHINSSIFQSRDDGSSAASSTVVGQYVAERRLNYCFEKKQGALSFKNNLNGLLILASQPTETVFYRIRKITAKFSTLARIPIAVVFVSSKKCNSLANFEEKLKNLNISKVHLVFASLECDALCIAVEKSLKFLADNTEKVPPLELDVLESFLRQNLVSDLWARITSLSKWNSEFKACLRTPLVCISLHQEAVNRLKSVLFDYQRFEYGDFANQEFDKLLLNRNADVLPCDYKYFPAFWKSETYRNHLANILDSLTLLSFENNTWPPENEHELKEILVDYCSANFQVPDKVFPKLFASIVRQLESDSDRLLKNVVWIEPIKVLVEEKFKEIDFSLSGTEFYKKSDFPVAFAIYDRESAKRLRNNNWYYRDNMKVRREMRIVEKNALQTPGAVPSRKRKLDERDDEKIDLDELERTLRAGDEEDDQRLRVKVMRKFTECIKDLEESMNYTKRICKRMYDSVKRSLNNNI